MSNPLEINVLFSNSMKFEAKVKRYWQRLPIIIDGYAPGRTRVLNRETDANFWKHSQLAKEAWLVRACTKDGKGTVCDASK